MNHLPAGIHPCQYPSGIYSPNEKLESYGKSSDFRARLPEGLQIAFCYSAPRNFNQHMIVNLQCWTLHHPPNVDGFEKPSKYGLVDCFTNIISHYYPIQSHVFRACRQLYSPCLHLWGFHPIAAWCFARPNLKTKCGQPNSPSYPFKGMVDTCLYNTIQPIKMVMTWGWIMICFTTLMDNIYNYIYIYIYIYHNHGWWWVI